MSSSLTPLRVIPFFIRIVEDGSDLHKELEHPQLPRVDAILHPEAVVLVRGMLESCCKRSVRLDFDVPGLQCHSPAVVFPELCLVPDKGVDKLLRYLPSEDLLNNLYTLDFPRDVKEPRRLQLIRSSFSSSSLFAAASAGMSGPTIF